MKDSQNYKNKLMDEYDEYPEIPSAGKSRFEIMESKNGIAH